MGEVRTAYTDARVRPRATDVRTASHAGTISWSADSAVPSDTALMKGRRLHAGDIGSSMIPEASTTLVMIAAK